MWVKVLMVLVTIVLIGLGTIYLLGISERGRWERYAATLREAGEPLTFAEIEARRADVPDERNSALVIISAMKDFPSDEAGLVSDLVEPNFLRPADLFDGIPRYVVDDSRTFLEKHRPLLDALRSVLDMPTGRINLAYAKNPILTPVPNLRHVLTASKLARLDALLRLVEGDADGAVEATVLQLHIAGSLNEYPALMGYLTARVCDLLGLKSVEDILRIGEVPESSLVRLSDVLVGRRTQLPLRWALWSERAMLVVVMDRLVSGEVKTLELAELASGAPSIPGLNLLPEFIIRKNQILAVELATRLVEKGEDLGAVREAAAQIGPDVDLLDGTCFLVKMLTQDLTGFLYRQMERETILDCTLIGIAAERFRLATGHWPASLDELVPAYLDQVPLDPFAEGQPLKLVATDQGIVIYSIGEDTIDGGGDVVADNNQRTGPDIGFRLLDPEHRRVVITDEPRPEDE